MTAAMKESVWSSIFADERDHERVEWGKKLLLFPAAPATKSLLSFQLIDDWIRYRQVRYPQFQVNLPSGGVPPTQYSETRQYLALTMHGSPVAERIAEQLRGGATLRFVDLEDWYPPITDLCDRLAETLNCVSRAYAFYTPPGDDGVHAHWDDADIFALQVDGAKTWHLWDVPEVGEWPENQTIDVDRKPDHVLQLSAGEGLYIPAGMGHRAIAGPAGSLHLSIALRPPTHRDVVMMWTEQVLAAFPLSARLPVVGDRAITVREILDAARAASERIDHSTIIDRAAGAPESLLSDVSLISGARPPGQRVDT
jgi:hypothetical protein